MFKQNIQFEILTPTGFQKFDGINKIKHNTGKELIFSDHTSLICSNDHPLVCDSGVILAQKLNKGDIINGNIRVIDINEYNIPDEYYDPINVDNGNVYISNNIVSHNCVFISSDHILIDYKKLQEREALVKDHKPAFVINDTQTQHKQEFYFRINKHYTYLIGVDAASGGGNDFGTIEVIEFPTMRQVMEYRSNTLSHTDFYSYLRKVLKFFEHNAKEVYFSVESNSVGQAVLALYDADDNKPEKAILISDEGKNKSGMVMTDKEKMAACLMLKEAFEKDILKLFSPILIKELKNFKRDKGAYNKKAGATDDCISGVLIALRLLKEVSMHDERAYNLLYKIDRGTSTGNDWVENFDELSKQNESEQIMPFIV